MRSASKFAGIWSGPVAVFESNGQLDEKGIRKVVNFLIDGGVNGLLAGALLSEWPSLDHNERKKIIAITVDEANERVPVFSGTGGSNVRDAFELMKYAEDVGADGIFLIEPYLYSLKIHELLDYIGTFAKATNLPIMLFNAPSHTGVNLDLNLYKKLVAEFDNIVAVKEANQAQLPEVAAQVGDKLAVLTSKDSYALESLLFGAAGVASSVACLAPKIAVELYQAFQKKDLLKAIEIQKRLIPLGSFLISEGLAVPVKAGLEMIGMPAGQLRKPLLPLDANKRKVLRSMLKDLGLLGETSG